MRNWHEEWALVWQSKEELQLEYNKLKQQYEDLCERKQGATQRHLAAEKHVVELKAQLHELELAHAMQIEGLKKSGNHWLDMWTEANKRVEDCEDSLNVLGIQMKQKDEYILDLIKNREAQIAHIKALEAKLTERNHEIEALKLEKQILEAELGAAVQPKNGQPSAMDWYLCYSASEELTKKVEAERDELKKRVRQLENRIKDALEIMTK